MVTERGQGSMDASFGHPGGLNLILSRQPDDGKIAELHASHERCKRKEGTSYHDWSGDLTTDRKLSSRFLDSAPDASFPFRSGFVCCSSRHKGFGWLDGWMVGWLDCWISFGSSTPAACLPPCSPLSCSCSTGVGHDGT